MARFNLKDQDYSFNASLDPMLVLSKMGFTEKSIYKEGDVVRVHCPIHKDLVRKSLIIDIVEKTYKCQYANCEAHEGGLLIELVALFYECDISEVAKALFGDEDKSSDLLFRGEMFINQGRHNEALPYLEQAVDNDPRNEITRCKLAALYLELSRKDDAYREYLKAAESYAVRGELDKTLSIYNILIMLQPGAVKARKELSYLFSRMGRPDAAAEQLKWVVDFYLKFNQTNGAQEACEQIIELDPENPMAYMLLAQLMQMLGKRVKAVQSFENAGRKFLASGEIRRGLECVSEAQKLAPDNNRLEELREELLEAREQGKEIEVHDDDFWDKEHLSQEEEFIGWMREMDAALESGAPPPEPPRNVESRVDVEIPLFDAMEDSPLTVNTNQQPNPLDTTEISPTDRRVALCLNDIRELSPQQLERMRQQLLNMFTDVRKSYEEGTLSDWEMRTIKDFYKCFCLAMDLNRQQSSNS